MFRRLSTLLLALAALTAAVPASAHASCDVVAAPSGSDSAAGTTAHPLRSAQAVIDRLQAGETGCLRGGRYTTDSANGYIARFGHGGTPDRPLALRSYPRERAVLAGVVYVTHDAPDVKITDLSIDDPTPYSMASEITVEINATRTTLARLDITNDAQKTCIILGSGDAGRAVGTTIRESVLHDCGEQDGDLFDHGIYAAHTSRLRVENNVIARVSGYAIHLYPDTQHALVRGNLIVDNGGGVIFAGEGDSASSDNRVTGNAIARSHLRPDISSWWGGRVGHGNIARRNCLGSGGIADATGFADRDNVVGQIRVRSTASRAFRLTDAGSCSALVTTLIAAAAVVRTR